MSTEDALRKRAIRSIRAKRAFQLHLSIYIAISILLVIIDWFTRPINTLTWAHFPILGWGLGVFINWYGVYRIAARSITESEIAEEMQKLK